MRTPSCPLQNSAEDHGKTAQFDIFKINFSRRKGHFVSKLKRPLAIYLNDFTLVKTHTRQSETMGHCIVDYPTVHLTVFDRQRSRENDLREKPNQQREAPSREFDRASNSRSQKDCKDTGDLLICVNLNVRSPVTITNGVSGCLAEIVTKAFSLSQYKHLNEKEKITLLQTSWHRLMIWLFAENDLRYEVQSLYPEVGIKHQMSGQRGCLPTLSSFDSILSLKNQYQSLQLDKSESNLVFKYILFNCGLGASHSVTEALDQVMVQLQVYLFQRRAQSSPLYGIIQWLNGLHSIKEQTVEKLFFQNVADDCSVRKILSEAIKQIHSNSPDSCH